MRRILSLILVVMFAISGIVMAETEEKTANEPVISYGTYETLEIGSKGNEVKQLQQALIEQGFLDGGADGIYGKGTAGGVTKFQESVGLEPTGIADNETQKKLFGDDELENIDINLTGVTETDHMRMDALFAVDGEENSKLYVFFTVFTPDQNITWDSSNLSVTINGINSYASYTVSAVRNWFSSYHHHGNYAIQFGKNERFVEVITLPSGELAAGRTITFQGDSGIGMEDISLVTDDIVHCSNSKIVVKYMDPDGYADLAFKMSPADNDTKNKVKKELSGEWELTNTAGIIKSFNLVFSGDKYTLKTYLNNTSGKYTVLNGFIKFTNSDTGAVNYCIWNFDENGKFHFKGYDLFDTDIGLDSCYTLD